MCGYSSSCLSILQGTYGYTVHTTISRLIPRKQISVNQYCFISPFGYSMQLTSLLESLVFCVAVVSVSLVVQRMTDKWSWSYFTVSHNLSHVVDWFYDICICLSSFLFFHRFELNSIFFLTGIDLSSGLFVTLDWHLFYHNSEVSVLVLIKYLCIQISLLFGQTMCVTMIKRRCVYASFRLQPDDSYIF